MVKKKEKEPKKEEVKEIKEEEKVEKKEKIKTEETPKQEKPEEKKIEVEEEIVEEEPIPPLKEEEKPVEKIVEEKKEEELVKWTPRTNLGKAVAKGEITDINKILDEGIKIKEYQIVDKLIPNLEIELTLIGGRPGKGGGIERTALRISAKMHRSGRRYTSTAFAVIGNKDGLVGIGKGSGVESRNAIKKAVEKAKLNIIKVPRGCGSWECGCGQPHSIPFRTEGKGGSVRVRLLPAPKGIGLVVDDESKKVMQLAGIKDVWTKSLGDTATRINLIKATFDALRNLHRYRTSSK
jgi:small subunit ribosomal protein S5